MLLLFIYIVTRDKIQSKAINELVRKCSDCHNNSFL